MTGGSFGNRLQPGWSRLVFAALMLALLCGCYTPAPRPDFAVVMPPQLQPETAQIPQLCVIIDDAGQRFDQIQPFLAIPASLTIAVLPGLPATRRTADAVRRMAPGKQLMLHQPMAPLNEKINPGPGAILAETLPEQIAGILQHNLDQMPGVQGMNNHMGSRITQNREQLDATMAFCKANHLFFIDSLTTSDSIAELVAKEHGVACAQRYIFLDNDRNVEAIRKQFIKGMQVAKRNGSVVMIGHAWSHETAQVIAEMVPTAEAADFSFHRVSDIVN